MKTRIKDIADIQIGFQARSKIEANPNGHCSIIQIKDFNGKRKLDYQTLSKFKPDREIERHLVRDKDILFVSRGYKNFAYALVNPPANTVAAGYFYVLRLNKTEVLPEYLAWYVNQPNIQIKLQNMARGTNIPLITKTNFERFVIDAPSLEIQKKIVELNKLVNKEKELLREIVRRRAQLAHAVSFKLIRQNSKGKD